MSLKRQMRPVGLILWRDWDPIGCGAPRDEYGFCIPEIMRLLLGRADRATLCAHLKRVAEEAMSCPISDERAARVAAKLRALDLARRQT